MREHFAGARELRTALVLGNLDDAREAGRTLSSIRGVEGLPTGSEVELQEMRNRGRAVAEARSLEEAGQAGADLARSCAACHRKYKVGPGTVFNDQPQETDERTLNHGVRADRTMTLLWEGVLAPADVAWRRGAARLADGVYIPDILAGRLENPQQIQEARDRLDRIGIRAVRVESQEERAGVLAEVWTECGACHRLIELNGG